MFRIIATTVFFILLLLSCKTAAAISFNHAADTLNTAYPDSILTSPDDTLVALNSTDTLKAAVDNQLPLVNKNRKKLISAVLAFPFPFGFMGAHRVMLGCKPWVPVVYVATFGGCFGILPLIDFCVIVFSKDVEKLENDPHIFMWAK